MDYVKGIPHKLLALEKFLEVSPRAGANPSLALALALALALPQP